jgi:hypothetical protein
MEEAIKGVTKELNVAINNTILLTAGLFIYQTGKCFLPLSSNVM